MRSRARRRRRPPRLWLLGLTALAVATASRPSLAEPPRETAAAATASPPRTRAALDEERVVDLALRAHPTVQAALAAREAAKAQSAAADLSRLPDLRVSGRYTRLSNIPEEYRSFGGFAFPQFLNTFGGRANLAVPLTDMFFGLASAARAAGRAADAAALEVVSARAEVAYGARVAFYEFWSRTVAVKNAAELVRAAENNAVDQRNRATAGTVARNDVLPFESALDSAVMGLLASRADLAVAEATLRTYLPDLREAELAVPDLPEETADLPPPRPYGPPSTPPRLAVLDMQARAADALADEASLARLPKLSLVGSFELAAPNPRVLVLTRLLALPTWEAGVQLEVALSQLTSGTYAAKKARAEHEALVAKLAEAKRRLDGERAGAAGVLVASHERVRRAGTRVGHALDLARARRGELEAGTALPLNVVVAETDLARAKNEYVEAFVERALARARLDFLDGRSAPSAKGGEP